jgi:hypothetical protein
MQSVSVQDPGPFLSLDLGSGWQHPQHSERASLLVSDLHYSYPCAEM